MRAVSVVTVAVLLAAPAGVAQVIEGTTNLFPFQPMAGFSAVLLVDWAGIGGTNTGPGTNDSPTPDGCYDSDNQAAIWGNTYVAIPSIGQKVVKQETTTLVPGSSTPAPPELIALCSAVRELVLGQPTGYQYSDDPQAVGHGDVTFEATSFSLVSGTFDGGLRAFPPSLGALLCEMDLDTFAGTAPQGDEVFADLGFPNGVLLALAADCLDVREPILAALVGDDPLQQGEWDPGAINEQGGATLWDLDLFDTERAFGLHAICLKATVFDGNNAVAGVFEDYGYFWVDGPENAYALVTNWSAPENSDGRAGAQECSSIGIAL